MEKVAQKDVSVIQIQTIALRSEEKDLDYIKFIFKWSSRRWKCDNFIDEIDWSL